MESAPARFELVQGEAITVGAGVTVRLEHVLYAHLSGSRNRSLMQLTVTRGAQTQSLTLERTEPGPPRYAEVFGLRLAIDYVDAYHQPSSGAIFVLFHPDGG